MQVARPAATVTPVQVLGSMTGWLPPCVAVKSTVPVAPVGPTAAVTLTGEPTEAEVGTDTATVEEVSGGTTTTDTVPEELAKVFVPGEN